MRWLEIAGLDFHMEERWWWPILLIGWQKLYAHSGWLRFLGHFYTIEENLGVDYSISLLVHLFEARIKYYQNNIVHLFSNYDFICSKAKYIFLFKKFQSKKLPILYLIPAIKASFLSISLLIVFRARASAFAMRCRFRKGTLGWTGMLESLQGIPPSPHATVSHFKL